MKLIGQVVDGDGKKVFAVEKEKTLEEQFAEMKTSHAAQAQELATVKAKVDKQEADIVNLKSKASK
jgi:hypothetical protein